ncbi:hypothetical protein, partial [Marinifilum sp. D737]|uniref:hypothetical protein n=1 Tax=Marinifilum sp. D737 TaxID=2969628 RepID=UPI0022746AB0
RCFRRSVVYSSVVKISLLYPAEPNRGMRQRPLEKRLTYYKLSVLFFMPDGIPDGLLFLLRSFHFSLVVPNVSRVWRRAAFAAVWLFSVLSFKFSLLYQDEPNCGMRYDPLLPPVNFVNITFH